MMFSISNEWMWLQIKEVYIDQIWSHKEYRVLCTRFNREGGTQTVLFFYVELHLESFLFTGSISTVLACFLQIAKCRANLKIVIFDNINTFKLNKDIKVKT